MSPIPSHFALLSAGLLAFAIGCSAPEATTATAAADLVTRPADRLEVRERLILGPNKLPIALRGWNWGQWGTAVAQNDDGKSDGVHNAKQGANIVRIPLRWWGQWGDENIDSRDPNGTPKSGYVKKEFLDQLDDTIELATDAGLWVDLFVDSNCGQASTENDTIKVCGRGEENPDQPANFLNSPSKKAEFIALWQMLAEKYANHPYIGMYEILPEPNFNCSQGCTFDDTAANFYRSVIGPVRKKDARTPIIVGATGGYDVENIESAFIKDVSGLIYTADILKGHAKKAYQDPDYLKPLTDFRDKHGVPLFIQQVGVEQSETISQPNGVVPASDIAKHILGELNKANIGWTWWTYREKHSGGDGYAPYWQGTGDQVHWVSNPAWLGMITHFFAQR